MTTQAIILDIDGTLLNDDKKISAETKKALITAQQTALNSSSRPADPQPECTFTLNN